MDTPGIGDIDQEDAAKNMMEYLPNALIVVFVLNVAATGGIQKDRVFTICYLKSFCILIHFVYVGCLFRGGENVRVTNGICFLFYLR